MKEAAAPSAPIQRTWFHRPQVARNSAQKRLPSALSGFSRGELGVERQVLHQRHAERAVEIEQAADQEIERAGLAPFQRRGDARAAGERRRAEEHHQKERALDRGDDRLHGGDAGRRRQAGQGRQHEGGEGEERAGDQA